MSSPERSSKPLATLIAAATILALGGAASAATIMEVEVNDTIVSAQFIPGSAFEAPPANVFNPPGDPTARINGSIGSPNDVDFYGFMSTGGRLYADIDNNPFTFDTILSLFDSTGTLLVRADDSFSLDPDPFDGVDPLEDPGTDFGQDSFLGIFMLPGPGTYYLAVSAFNNSPLAYALLRPDDLTELFRPDGASGGFAVTNVQSGNSTFSGNEIPDAGGSYSLFLSVQNPATTPVPEPLSLVLFGTGLVGVAMRARRRSGPKY